ncbi:DoxX family protein [Yoonia litorea]|uniref:DoxX-like family protein n=1 Tax=Yoonia litorea TaxID=1123755 RepID=A0A1I6L9H3_9RHOB|nr:DoxX family protein [Yoonia litorea]SFR99910.1 DoxX-like family protein [Yoonia litorea]
MKYVPIVARVLLTIAFVMAGGAKLAGAAQMVDVFEAIGLGQWFRYLTGVIEVGGAAMLWYKPTRILGALLLGATMVGAIIAHVLVLGPSTLPAIILGILTVIVIRFERQPAS